MRWKSNRTIRIILIAVVVLIGLRVSLPFVVKRYVNKVLGEIPGYRGEIDGVTIQLIRGAYQIDSLRIFKINGNEQIPFMNIPVMDLSIEWSTLLQGEVVGEVRFEKPVLNFISGKKGGVDAEETGGQSGEDVDWTRPIKKLMPLQINYLTIEDGTVAFYDFTTNPHVDLFLRDVQVEAQNLNNASDNPDLLPSRVFLRARSIGNGILSISMKINVLKKLPDLDMDLKFENVYMPALNDFFAAYAKADVERGNFNLYSEVAVLDGKVNGYIKPLFNNLEVVDWEEEKKKPLNLVWESVVGFLVEVFENQEKNQFATRVPLQGRISNVNSPFWPALWNIFRNAFVSAFEKNTDGTVTIASGKQTGEKSRKEKRKEERRKKREEKKERKKTLPNP